MTRRRKKHPGGRPPRDPSGPTSPLTVRLTDDERDRCATAAGDEPLATWASRALVAATDRPRFSTLDDILSWERGLDDDGRYLFGVDLGKVLLSDSSLL